MLSFLPRLHNNNKPVCRNIRSASLDPNGSRFRLRLLDWLFAMVTGRLVSFPWHYCPISLDYWIDLRYIDVVKLLMLLGLSSSFLNPVSGTVSQLCDMERRSLSSSSYYGSQKGAGDSILIMSKSEGRIPIYSSWRRPVNSGYTWHDDPATPHIQVRRLCRVKSMKHAWNLPMELFPIPDTFQLGLCFEHNRRFHIHWVIIDSSSPDTFACRKELYHLDTVTSRRWI